MLKAAFVFSGSSSHSLGPRARLVSAFAYDCLSHAHAYQFLSNSANSCSLYCKVGTTCLLRWFLSKALYKGCFACLDGLVQIKLLSFIPLHKGRLFGLNFGLFVLSCFFLVVVAFERSWWSFTCGFWLLASGVCFSLLERTNLERKQ